MKEPHVNVKRAMISGGVQFDHVNGFDLETIKANAIWLNRPNNVAVPITFSGQVRIQGNLSTAVLNNVDFTAFAGDLVYKSDAEPLIKGTTIFRKNLLVSGDIDAMQVNGYSVGHMLRKGSNLPIPNPINVYGDVFVSDLMVNGSLGGIAGNRIWENYYFDEVSQAHILNTNVRFNNGVHVVYLKLDGRINDVQNASNYLETVLRKGQLSEVNGVKTFADAVHFENDVQIIDYNGIAVEPFLSNVILIDQSEPIDVHSVVVFNEAVSFTTLNVNGALKVDTIADCSVAEWFTNAIRTDLPYQFDQTVTFGAGTIEVGNIELTYLNDHLAQHIVTLNTEQHFIDENVDLGEVIALAPFNISGSVDGIDLAAERANTLMVTPHYLPISIPNFRFIPFHIPTGVRRSICHAEYGLPIGSSFASVVNRRHR